MSVNNLSQLKNYGQSVWLDYISRDLLKSNKLKALISDDGLRGVTSNPSIFEKAITQSEDYTHDIESLLKKGVSSAQIIYEALAVKDIQQACDILRPIYDETQCGDGFASLEVSPHLAFDKNASIDEAKRLWHMVDRPNLMIKIPGTNEGIDAVEYLIEEGININITLLFSKDSYERSAYAYLNGLKKRSEKGLPIDSVQSVASFFISRIDTKVDNMIMATGNKEAKRFLGTVAIANAKLAYQSFKKIYHSELATLLLRKGANKQRLLWASTSTKNEAYKDVLYVESLIGDYTVNTLPLATLNAFRDHGVAKETLTLGIKESQLIMNSLSELGIDFNVICKELLKEGIKIFADAYDSLIDSLDSKFSS